MSTTETLFDTISQAIAFTVYGKPEPAGSKRGFAFKRKNGNGIGVAISDANPKSRDWKNQVSHRAAECHKGELLDGPLSLSLVFHLPRPKGHFGKSGLKMSAPHYQVGRPDVLKLARAVEDALTGIVWRDDSQVVHETLQKRYGEPSRVEIVVQRMP